MRHLRSIGVAVIAAAALVVITGTGPASAFTVLCEGGAPVVGQEGCKGVPGGHEKEYKAAKVTASSTNFALVTNLGTVTCPTSSTTLEPEGPTAEAGGKIITGTVSALSFGPACKLGSTACELIVKNLPYTAHLHGTWEEKTDTSTLTVTGVSFQAKCGSFINCTFGLPELKLMGDNNATPTATSFKAENVNLNREGGVFCPNAAVLSGTYNVTAPAGFTVH